ncbi:MAG: hypothetical protein ACK5D5_10115 [Bacteroidota bacterium]
MKDVLWTIFLTWLIWKIWSFFSKPKRVYVQKNEFKFYQNTTGEEKNSAGKNKSTPKKPFMDEGEYFDFEEIKK